MSYTLSKSKKNDKRFKIDMPAYGHSHSFGSKGGKTYIDSRTEKEKRAWINRHKQDKGWDNKHAGIYYARHLLWGPHKSLEKNIKALERKDKVKIKKKME